VTTPVRSRCPGGWKIAFGRRGAAVAVPLRAAAACAAAPVL